jgi:hypothetical protein
MRYKSIIAFLLITLPVFSQKIKTVEGEYLYHAPENVTIEQAKRTAVERAKIQALATEFGTIVSQSSTTSIANINGESSTNVLVLSGSDVKGEWIEDLGEPKVQVNYEGDMLVVTAKVKGKAREILSAGVDFTSKILRNGKEDKFESDDFKNGDDLYLAFQTPAKGYLAVYLVDAENMAYCLLPYRNQTDGIYPVNANQRYLFFCPEEAPEGERALVDEYALTCERQMEYNYIYVIFSRNQFTKANDAASNKQIDGYAGAPRELSYEDFQKWLSKCMKHDAEMNMKKIPIIIKK